MATSVAALKIAREHADVYAAVGMHPHEAARFQQEKARLRDLLNEENVVAIGEIGLDYYRDRAPRAIQLEAFREQLLWARERDLPVSVHNREADEDVLAEMIRAGVRGVLHCFSGSWDMARPAIDAGFTLSFAGNVTYPTARTLRSVARDVPLDRLLLETDAPVLAPVPRRGRRSEPAYVTYTCEAIGEARGEAPEVVARAASENANRMFGWGES